MCLKKTGQSYEIFVLYFISNEMIVTQKYRLIWMRSSEKIIVGISKYKDRKNTLDCPSNILPNPGALGYK